MRARRSPSPIAVGELQLGDVFTIPDTDVVTPVKVTGVTNPTPPAGGGQVRFITTADAATGAESSATLCLNVERDVLRYEKGAVPPDQVETKSFFGI